MKQLPSLKTLIVGAAAMLLAPVLAPTLPAAADTCCPTASKPTAKSSLYETFRTPPNTAKPYVRWWWNGDKLSAKEILRELDVMKANGIGGVEINPIAFPGGNDLGIPSLRWLSPEWIEMVRVALKGAAERGIVCDMIVGSGWPFGTEVLEGAERSQVLTRTGRKLVGPGTVEIKLADLMNEAAPRVHSFRGRTSRIHALALTPEKIEKFVAPKWVKFDPKKETVKIEVPAGNHVLSALVEYTGYQSVINGAPGAAGPVLNHYNEAAVSRFLNLLSDNLFPKIKDIKPSMRALFCDSMELEGANWCPDFVEEFQRRRGYDISPYLPYIIKKIGGMGHRSAAVETQLSGSAKEEITRANYDFVVTCMEIITDRFLKPYTKWCNEHGFKSRVQTYGNEFHPLEASLNIDIPECETWVAHGPWGYTNINKFVASAARYSGKNIVSCEEITNTNRVFNTTLEQVKIIGDESNLSGVTHSILHGYNYSPLETPFPGWVRYGTFFNERNTWWPFFKKWAAYKTRLSALLLETTPFADIALMHPLADMWTIHGPQRDPFPGLKYPRYQYNVWEGVHMNGNSCDYTSEGIIQKSTVEKGWLKYGPRKYKTLVLIEVETMAPETAQKLADFAASGGKLVLIAKTPHKAPGLANYKENNKRVAGIFNSIKKKYPKQVFTVPACGNNSIEWFAEVMKKTGIEPYVKIDKPNGEVSQIRQQSKDGKDIFFFSNKSGGNRHVLRLKFTQSKGTPWEWNAETGERFILPRNDDGTLTLDLAPAGSKIIVFDSLANGPKLPVRPAESDPVELRDWTLTLEHVNGKKDTRQIEKPFDFSKNKETQTFAGYAVYERKLPADASGKNYIDLGKVHGTSEVWLESKTTSDGWEKIGEHWYGRHLYFIPADASGKRIKIKVATTLGNYFKTNRDIPTGHRWTRGQPWTSTGLVGPVTLR
ncbi:MAG: hypothetical protein LBS59_06490 [Puniceicoccales bacterium]|jgi:hypothetical protein|nr:hypothetical protein [Puniceicoccales bacterium]